MCYLIRKIVRTVVPQILRHLLKFGSGFDGEMRGEDPQMDPTASFRMREHDGAWVKEHARCLRQGKASETGRGYSYHLDNHELGCMW